VQSKTTEQSRIQKECEMLMTGQKPIISIIDNHVEAVKAYKGVLDNPNLRANASIVALVLEAITEHLELMETMKFENPDLLDLALSQPIGTTRQAMAGQMPQPGQGAPVQEGAAPEQGAPQPSGPAEGSADAAMDGGTEDIAESGRATAERRLANISGEEQQVDSISG